MTAVVVVGCGAAVRNLYSAELARWAIEGSTRLLTLDLDADAAAQMARDIGGSAVESLEAAAEAGASAAIVATPHSDHHVTADRALRLGMHVFIEKPAAVNAGLARTVAATATAAGLLAMVNNSRRLFPSYSALAKQLTDPRVGALRSIRVFDGAQFNWPMRTPFYLTDRESRGVLMDRGAHTVDVVTTWAARELKVASCQHDGFDGPDATSRVELTGVDDDVEIELRFSRLHRLPNRFEITTDRAEFRGNLFSWTRFERRSRGGRWQTVAAKHAPRRPEEFTEHLLRRFRNTIENKSAPPFTIDDVIPSLQLIDDAYDCADRSLPSWYEYSGAR